ncbi:MAG: DNA-processing protein DprA, partial [Elusimicrobia bacterium]|nr:DNA-processing protein DprA [Elusimicrobiota bacterium]
MAAPVERPRPLRGRRRAREGRAAAPFRLGRRAAGAGPGARPGARGRAAVSAARVLAKADLEYPELLRALSDSPATLWVRGALSAAAPAVAVVGSRRPTPYGRRMARLLAGG